MDEVADAEARAHVLVRGAYDAPGRGRRPRHPGRAAAVAGGRPAQPPRAGPLADPTRTHPLTGPRGRSTGCGQQLLRARPGRVESITSALTGSPPTSPGAARLARARDYVASGWDTKADVEAVGAERDLPPGVQAGRRRPGRATRPTTLAGPRPGPPADGRDAARPGALAAVRPAASRSWAGRASSRTSRRGCGTTRSERPAYVPPRRPETVYRRVGLHGGQAHRAAPPVDQRVRRPRPQRLRRPRGRPPATPLAVARAAQRPAAWSRRPCTSAPRPCAAGADDAARVGWLAPCMNRPRADGHRARGADPPGKLYADQRATYEARPEGGGRVVRRRRSSRTPTADPERRPGWRLATTAALAVLNHAEVVTRR